MSESSKLRTAVSLLVAFILFGCDGAKSCQPCERPPKTVRIEADWQALADALKETLGTTPGPRGPVGPEGPRGPQGPPGTPVLADSVNVTLEGWGDMVDVLKSIQSRAQTDCVDCGSGGAASSTHNIYHNTTFAFRFAPPWFNADQRSLFTSYVVFPVEAKFDDWIDRPPGENCNQEEGKWPSVCPDTAFYKKAMEPFLNGLARCATDKRTELHMVGFASSTRLEEAVKNGGGKVDKLKRRYDSHMDSITSKAGVCRGEVNEAEDDLSNMFNLLIANERAANAAAMLKNLVPTHAKGAFDIRTIRWCSHASMVQERKHEDDGDAAKGLMNRRVEVRLASLPGCLNVDPDKRIDGTG